MLQQSNNHDVTDNTVYMQCGAKFIITGNGFSSKHQLEVKDLQRIEVQQFAKRLLWNVNQNMNQSNQIRTQLQHHFGGKI